MLKMLAVAVVALVIGGGGAYFLLHKEEAASGPSKKSESAGADMLEEDDFITLPPLIVNLNESSDEAHYLKCTIALGISSAKYHESLEKQFPRIKHTILLHLSGLTMSQLSGQKSKAQIADDLLKSLQEFLGGRKITSVLFTEFVVQ